MQFLWFIYFGILFEMFVHLLWIIPIVAVVLAVISIKVEEAIKARWFPQ